MAAMPSQLIRQRHTTTNHLNAELVFIEQSNTGNREACAIPPANTMQIGGHRPNYGEKADVEDEQCSSVTILVNVWTPAETVFASRWHKRGIPRVHAAAAGRWSRKPTIGQPSDSFVASTTNENCEFVSILETVSTHAPHLTFASGSTHKAVLLCIGPDAILLSLGTNLLGGAHAVPFATQAANL